MTYEDQKQEIIKNAEDMFGSDFLQQIDELTKDLMEEEVFEMPPLKVNFEGAFYACPE